MTRRIGVCTATGLAVAIVHLQHGRAFSSVPIVARFAQTFYRSLVPNLLGIRTLGDVP
jgi:hypothetical protein